MVTGSGPTGKEAHSHVMGGVISTGQFGTSMAQDATVGLTQGKKNGEKHLV